MGADLVDEPHEDPNAHAIEFSVRDPAGYALTVSQWSAEVRSSLAHFVRSTATAR